MSVLDRFTVRSLKLNKRRTLVTIIGIMLSTALICAVTGLISSFRETLIESSIKSFGNCHVIFQNVTEKEAGFVDSNRNIKSTYTVAKAGWSEYSDCARKGVNYVQLLAYNDEAYKSSCIRLIDGRYPTDSSEVAVTEKYFKNNKNNIKLGDSITLDINEYVRMDLDKKQETAKPQKKTYKLVGIVDDSISKVSGSYDYYAITTYNESELEKTAYKDIFVLFDDVSIYKDSIEEIDSSISNKLQIVNDIDMSDMSNQYIAYSTQRNNDLLRWIGVGFSDSIMSALYEIGALVIAIIIISSVFVIRNSFEISTSEKMKQYGVLSSVGATSKQIRKSVLFEGLVLSAVSIPLGIIVGAGAVGILMLILNKLTPVFLNNIEFSWTISPIALLLTILLAMITIMLSSLSAARRASKVSPIESIRNSEKIKSKKIKAPRMIRSMFGVSGDIAYKNLKRSRKKYRTTVISIIVSVVIFIVTASLMDYGFKMQEAFYTGYDYNMCAYMSSDYSKEEKSKIVENILSMENVEMISCQRDKSAIVSKEHFTEFVVESLKYNDNVEDVEEISITVISVGDDAYRKFLDKIGKSYESCKDKGILLDEETYSANGKKYNGHLYNYEAGDKITISSEDEKKNTELEIAFRTNERPMGLESTYTTGGYMVVSDEYMDSLNKKGIETHSSGYIYIKSDDPDMLTQRLVELSENNSLYANVNVINMNKMKKQNDAMILIISIFLYGFLAVITLIGVTNIFNTITTNMNLRKKELAMLKSVGMTSSEFGRMIRLESLFYGTKSLLIGLPIGLGLSWLMYKGFESGMEMDYIFPLRAVIIAVLFVMIVISLIMNYSVRKIGNQNIIETIRNDNI